MDTPLEPYVRSDGEPIAAASINTMTVAERVAFTRTPFHHRLRVLAGTYVSYFWWMEPPLRSPFIHCVSDPTPRNGSILFLNFDGRLFGVTAAHVYRGYLASMQKFGRMICNIGHYAFDPQACLVSIGDEKFGVDIATFSLPSDALAQIGRKQALNASKDSWPPPHPFSDQGVFFAGYPGPSKIWIDRDKFSLGVYIASQPIGSASDRQLSMPFSREHWIDSSGLGLPPEGYDLGGISGGPVLMPFEQKGEWSMQLAGVISEARCGRGYESVIATPAHFIGSDGTVNSNLSAPIRFAERAS